MKKLYNLLLITIFVYTDLYSQLSPGDLHKTHAFLEGIQNCTKCHVQAQKLDPENCLNCHSLLKNQMDKRAGLHANSEYRDCVNCHVDHLGREYEMIFWGADGKTAFDHSKTGYNLSGAHTKLECRKCHNETKIKDKEKLLNKSKDLNRTFLGLDIKCSGCHRDEHRGQLSNDCQNCHNLNSWKATNFDHNKTRFSLTGKHMITSCEKCHTLVLDNKPGGDSGYLKFSIQKFKLCQDCHNNVHNNRFGSDCTYCHNTSAWAEYNSKNFNHKTLYPLVGKHASLKCNQCHKPGSPFKIVRFQHCMDCHSDFHKGQFAKRERKGACEECHSVKGFNPSAFTLEMHQECDYPLKGGHLAVPCTECHKPQHTIAQVNYIPFRFNDKRCIACHRDVHNGETNSVGAKGCELCHVVNSWRQISYDHSQTQFKLEGRHDEADCIMCHKTTTLTEARMQFRGINSKCSSCHNDVHSSQFADQADCSSCHSPVDWLADRFSHDEDSRFKLKGAHENVSCKKCHFFVAKNGKEVTVYKPLDVKCESCHNKASKG
jgi:hypothetical protein